MALLEAAENFLVKVFDYSNLIAINARESDCDAERYPVVVEKYGKKMVSLKTNSRRD